VILLPVINRKKNRVASLCTLDLHIGVVFLFLLFCILDFSFENKSMQTERIIEYITKWLVNYHNSSYTKGFAVGVSGGIDSAVVSTLCARTGLPTVVMEMPIRQSSAEVQRSRAHINWLTSKYSNVTSGEVNLTDVFESFVKTVENNPLNEQNSYTEVALANTRSRLRMVKICRTQIQFDFDLIFLRLIYIISLHSKVISLLVPAIKSKTLASDFLLNTVIKTQFTQKKIVFLNCRR